MTMRVKLLIPIALIVTVGGPVGWKWAAKPKATRALVYAIAPADATVPDASTLPDASTGPGQVASPDTSPAPADVSAPDSSPSPGTFVNPDGWTWDTGE